jgi:hypothetical protein
MIIERTLSYGSIKYSNTAVERHTIADGLSLVEKPLTYHMDYHKMPDGLSHDTNRDSQMLQKR